MAAKLQNFMGNLDHKLVKQGGVCVFYTCGMDHAIKCRLLEGGLYRWGIGVLVCPRDGEAPTVHDTESFVFSLPFNEIDAVDQAVNDLSSTKVRGLLSRITGEDVREEEKAGIRSLIVSMIGPQALAYILTEGLRVEKGIENKARRSKKQS